MFIWDVLIAVLEWRRWRWQEEWEEGQGDWHSGEDYRIDSRTAPEASGCQEGRGQTTQAKGKAICINRVYTQLNMEEMNCRFER